MRRLPRPQNASLARLIRELPLPDLVLLATGIFVLFGLFGIINDITSGGHTAPAKVVFNTLLSGLVAVGFAFGTLRRNWQLLFGALAVQVLWFTLTRGGPAAAGQTPNAVQLQADAVSVFVLMIIAYTAFLGFINGTAARYLRVRAEMDLAHEIHQVLVPAIDTRVGPFEFLGFSAASGEVGGDLVDLVAN